MRTVSVTDLPPDADPAINTMGSPDLASPTFINCVRATSQRLSMSLAGETKISWTPHEDRSCRAVDSLGVIATIGIGGRKREIARAVMPERVQATIATAFSSIAARHAAPVIAAVTLDALVLEAERCCTPSPAPHSA